MNDDKRRKQNAEYRAMHREEIRLKNKAYREAHKQERAEYNRQFKQKHREEINRKRRERRAEKAQDAERRRRLDELDLKIPEFIKPKYLAGLIAEYHKTDKLTAELSLVIRQIIVGYCSKYVHNRAAHDDLVSIAWIIVVEQLHIINPDKNCFAYISTIIQNSFRYQHFKKESEATGLAKYAQTLDPDLYARGYVELLPSE